MNQNEFVPQIPYGTRDFLPREASRKRAIEAALAGMFVRWGYDEVVTPTIEYLDTLTLGAGCEVQQNLFKFFDKNNHLLALRPDMTTPIARVAASRLRESPLPLKLFYLTNVFRYEQAQAGRQCEFYQAGVELMGAAGPTGDAEVIALAVESMREAGLAEFQISLGQVEFINGIMEESGLALQQRQQVKLAMLTRDLVGLGEILAISGLSREVQHLLQRIPVWHGREDMLDQALTMVTNEKSRGALANLAEIYQLLKVYGVEQYVTFDLGIIRDFDYYTGMVFEGYTPGLGFPLCGGGRYDQMLNSFGAGAPATGFALGIERIMLALERQGKTDKAEAKNFYVAWPSGRLAAAITKAGQLRKSGYSVEVACQAQTEREAAASQTDKGFERLIYLTED
ncbi:ATP phosphoribosyltransferase regulatory subunit [Dendrosporobacter quercicolus]|uniref:ATP phosphoribosyltransferase regulatory subunit n=1 Tax=Dendrosporobacter quercicolus TaxID=146817 RepID=A0A1G9NXA5_9FIRM|nr:ATP phosphoribosyltransferase regulatory subunit [Dendrosporobacter quercicolus]SDL90991.1 ATP phosphoribosyltransferase regulatory subunit [Dendrosporobacter quercicolus]